MVQNTSMSRKRELKQEKLKKEEEEDEMLNKKMKKTSGKKSLPSKIVVKEESEDDIEEESDGDDITTDADAEAPLKTPQVKKEKKKKPRVRKPLHENPTIQVKGLQPTATTSELKAHFAGCGAIMSCKFTHKKTKQPTALITFKSIAEAKRAVSKKNDKPFQGRNIMVTLLKTSYYLTSENAVILKGLPKDNLTPNKVYLELKNTMQKFGKVVHIKFTKKMQVAYVQFENKRGVTAALKAGQIELFGSKVRVSVYCGFQSPDTQLTIFGLTYAISEADVEAALLEHCPVVSVSYATNPITKSGEGIKSQVTAVFETAEAVEEILALETLKVKNMRLDVLPHCKSAHFFDSETNAYRRHPAGVFVEELPRRVGSPEILAEMTKFGPVMHVAKLKNFCALVIYEEKADAERALDAPSPTVQGWPVKLHAMDGVYTTSEKPALKAGTTVYISNIPDRKDIGEIVKKIAAAQLRFKCVFPNDDPIAKTFKNSMFVVFDSKDTAKAAVKTNITLGDDHEVKIERYKPAKHDFLT